MTRSIRLSTMLASTAALALALPASAQDVRDLDDQPSDVRIYSGTFAGEPVVYRLTLEEDSTIQVDVVPDEESGFDPVLTVTDADSGEVLVEDDDGGEGLGSRAVIHAEDDMQIEISVAAFAMFSGNESAGPFQLELRENSVEPPKKRSIDFGGSVSDEMGTGATHLFTITGEEGQLLQVVLNAEDENLDPYLSLFEGENTSGEPLISNDDGGEGLNSLLRFVLPEDGTYTILAEPFGDSSGAYALNVAPVSYPTIQAPVQVLGLGERVSGRLGEGYQSGSLDPTEITYQLTPEAIEAIRNGSGEVTFNMMRPAFEDGPFASTIDAYLELGFKTPLGFASMRTDDDGGEELNARIAINLAPIAEEAGWLERLTIRATSIGNGGAFEIEMVEGLQEIEDDYGYEEYMPEMMEDIIE